MKPRWQAVLTCVLLAGWTLDATASTEQFGEFAGQERAEKGSLNKIQCASSSV